jgi:perosamine synthetase
MKNKEIFLSVPNLDLKILENLKETIESGWVSTGGRFIKEFEQKISIYTGARAAKGVQSGTAGLHVALRVLGVVADDEVIVPTLTFIATVNPVKYLKAHPIFMDCDDSLNMDPVKLRAFLEEECRLLDGRVINKRTNRQIKGIILVHVFGNPANIEPIMEITKEYNLFLLEDSTEALGSYYTSGPYKDKHCGTIGHMGVYSFNANKIITTGNGGMVVSDDVELLEKVEFLSTQAKSDPLRYIHDDYGYNYRLTNISAAFGVNQLDHLENFIAIKKKNYELYMDGILNISGLSLLPFNTYSRPNYWFYSLVIDEQEYGLNREQLMCKLLELNIHTRPIWGLIHEQKPYRREIAYKVEKSTKYVKKILNIPCSTNLITEEVQVILDTLKKLSKK